MRARVREIQAELKREGLTVTLPEFMAPGDIKALWELYREEESKPFQFHVIGMSLHSVKMLKVYFPMAKVIQDKERV